MTSTRPRRKRKVPFNPDQHIKSPKGFDLDFQPEPVDVVRFLKKILFNHVSGCWIWDAAKDDKGYGAFHYKGRVYWAHRFSYAVFRRPLLPGFTVEHKCRNPSCVHPWHLELLSNSENVANGNRHRSLPPENSEVPF